jgi:hypothetical protein
MGEKSTMEEVLERLARIEAKLDFSSEKHEKQDVKNKDFEKRLRYLEKGLWMIVGIIALIEIYTKMRG